MRQNMLRHRPWLDRRVVSGKQQNTGESVAVAETGNAHQFIDEFGGILIARNGGEYAELCLGHCYRSCTTLAEIPNVQGDRSQLLSVAVGSSNEFKTSGVSISPSIAAAALTLEPMTRDSTVQIRPSKLT
jgi:hypothetical protein